MTQELNYLLTARSYAAKQPISSIRYEGREISCSTSTGAHLKCDLFMCFTSVSRLSRARSLMLLGLASR